MLKKQTLRFFLNILMIALVLVSILNKLTGTTIHEVVGIVIVVCILIHLVINIKWFTTFFKRKVNFTQLLNSFIILLLFIDLATLFISSIFISKFAFNFLGLKSTLMLQQIHTTSAYWFFILASVHLGINWQRFMIFIKKLPKYEIDINRKIITPIFVLISLFIIVYASIVFIDRDITQKLFMMFAFEYWNEAQSKLKIVVDYISMILAFVILTRALFNIKNIFVFVKK